MKDVWPQRTFTTGNATIVASITIVSRSGGDIVAGDISFLKDYLNFLEQNWSRQRFPAARGAQEHADAD